MLSKLLFLPERVTLRTPSLLSTLDKLISEVLVQSAGRPFDAISEDLGEALLELDLPNSDLLLHPTIVPTAKRIKARLIILYFIWHYISCYRPNAQVDLADNQLASV